MPLRSLHTYVSPPSSICGSASIVRGTSFTGQGRRSNQAREDLQRQLRQEAATQAEEEKALVDRASSATDDRPESLAIRKRARATLARNIMEMKKLSGGNLRAAGYDERRRLL